jgi:hypothetical protein
MEHDHNHPVMLRFLTGKRHQGAEYKQEGKDEISCIPFPSLLGCLIGTTQQVEEQPLLAKQGYKTWDY